MFQAVNTANPERTSLVVSLCLHAAGILLIGALSFSPRSLPRPHVFRTALFMPAALFIPEALPATPYQVHRVNPQPRQFVEPPREFLPPVAPPAPPLEPNLESLPLPALDPPQAPVLPPPSLKPLPKPAGFVTPEVTSRPPIKVPLAPTGAFDTVVATSAHSPVSHLAPVIPAVSTTTPVEILDKPRPSYTDEARRLNIQGEVLLEVVFEAAGGAQVLRIIRGLGHGLDETASAAAGQIHFRPAHRDGSPVDSIAVVHITFELAN